MINIPSFNQLLEQISSCTEADVQRSLRDEHPDVNGLAALLSPAADSYLENMAQRSAEITAMRFGKTTQIYAPLYLSSFCTNPWKVHFDQCKWFDGYLSKCEMVSFKFAPKNQVTPSLVMIIMIGN